MRQISGFVLLLMLMSQVLSIFYAYVKLQGKDNMQRQMYENILVPNRGYCVYYSSNILSNKRDLSVCNISARKIMILLK